MAAGDLLTAEVVPGTQSEGCYLDLTFEGMNVGGTYDFGLGTNNAVEGQGASPKVALTVVRKGFDNTGAATTKTETVYGVPGRTTDDNTAGAIRLATPNDTSRNETFATNTTVRIGLSKPVWAKDKAGVGNSGTDITLELSAGFYTEGGTPSAAASGFTVTNSSVLDYPIAPNAKWKTPGFQRAIPSSFTLQAFAYHTAFDETTGLQVACVKFTVTGGTSAVSRSKTITAPTVEILPTGLAAEFWQADFTDVLSDFTQDEVLTCNFIAYPWIGETTADSSAGTVDPTTDDTPGPIEWICDKNETYPGSVAVVDADDGDDGTGVAIARSAFDSGSPPAAFQTPRGAAAAIRTRNNSEYGRDDVGNSIIYVRAATAAYVLTGTAVGGDVPKVWLELKRFPGDSRDGISFGNATSGTANVFNKRVKLDGIRWTGSGSTNQFLGTVSYVHVWAHDCELNTTALAPLSNLTLGYFTNCLVTEYGTAGMRPFSTNNTPHWLTVGCTIDATTFSAGLSAYCCVGNLRSGTGALTTQFFIANINGSNQPTVNRPLIANNAVYGVSSDISLVNLANPSDFNLHTGMVVFVQNILERTGTGLVQPIANIVSGITITVQDNVLLLYNLFLGSRTINFYNDEGTDCHFRRNCRVFGDVRDLEGIKTDTFGTPNANRIGNWMCVMGCWWSGNFVNQADALSNGFTHEAAGGYLGFPSIEYQPADPQSHTNYGFVDFGALTSAGAGSGGGDYHTTASSPLRGLTRGIAVKYDIAGTARAVDANGQGDAGVYQDSASEGAPYGHHIRWRTRFRWS